ncbi:hypothetical protein D3C81_2214300 [compost metagenome]
MHQAGKRVPTITLALNTWRLTIRWTNTMSVSSITVRLVASSVSALNCCKYGAARFTSSLELR